LLPVVGGEAIGLKLIGQNFKKRGNLITKVAPLLKDRMYIRLVN
jgi:hypothetical protein